MPSRPTAASASQSTGSTEQSWEAAPRLMSLRQAAQLCGVPPSTFRNYLNTTPDLEAALVFRPGGGTHPHGSRRVLRTPLRLWLDGELVLPGHTLPEVGPHLGPTGGARGLQRMATR